VHGKLNGKNLQLVTVEAPQFQEATLAQLAFNEGIGSVLQMVRGENMLNLAPSLFTRLRGYQLCRL